MDPLRQYVTSETFGSFTLWHEALDFGCLCLHVIALTGQTSSCLPSEEGTTQVPPDSVKVEMKKPSLKSLFLNTVKSLHISNIYVSLDPT